MELKCDPNPVCLHPYPVPKVHEEMLIKEVYRLESFGVLEHANQSEWVFLSFAHTKVKTNQVEFMSNFRHLNR